MLSNAAQEWLYGEVAAGVRRGATLSDFLFHAGRSAPGVARGRAAVRLAELLAAGEPLDRAVAHLNAFPSEAAAVVANGTKAGRLAEALDALAADARGRTDVRHMVAHAFLYPVTISVFATLITLTISYFIAPMFIRVTSDSFYIYTELPFLTRNILWLAPTLTFLLVILPATVLVLLYVLPSSALPGRRTLDRVRLGVPLLGGVLRRACLARWCATMAVQSAAGIPAPAAIRSAGQSTANVWMAHVSEHVAREVEGGTPLGSAMVHGRFPGALTWMVNAAEKGLGTSTHVWPIAQGIYSRDLRAWSLMASSVMSFFFFAAAILVVGQTVCALFLPFIRMMQWLG